jgi:hypothetical protein
LLDRAFWRGTPEDSQLLVIIVCVGLVLWISLLQWEEELTFCSTASLRPRVQLPICVTPNTPHGTADISEGAVFSRWNRDFIPIWPLVYFTVNVFHTFFFTLFFILQLYTFSMSLHSLVTHLHCINKSLESIFIQDLPPPPSSQPTPYILSNPRLYMSARESFGRFQTWSWVAFLFNILALRIKSKERLCVCVPLLCFPNRSSQRIS